MDYICKRKNNIKSISITADCTGPRDKKGSQREPHATPTQPSFPPTLDWNLRPVVALIRPHPLCLARGAKGAWELEFSSSSLLTEHSQDPLMIQRVYHRRGYVEKDKTKARVK